MNARARGFTLIEVLVALAIVAVGMAAVLGAMTSAADSVIYLRDKTFAEWIALNRIVEVRVQGMLPATGKTSGDTEFAGRRWRWEQEVQDLQVKGMRRIDVQVRPAEIAANEKGSWYSAASGVMGDAVNYAGRPATDLNPALGFDPIPPPNPSNPPGG